VGDGGAGLGRVRGVHQGPAARADALDQELEATIEKTPCDLVLVGTPIDLTRVLKIGEPAARVRYELEPLVPGLLEEEIRKFVR